MTTKSTRAMKRGEAAIAGFDPFAELLTIALRCKARYKAAPRGAKKDKAERELVAIALELLPYTKPKLQSVEAKIEGTWDLTVEIGSSD